MPSEKPKDSTLLSILGHGRTEMERKALRKLLANGRFRRALWDSCKRRNTT